MSWVKSLPLALLNGRTMPHLDTGLSLFEMLYGMPIGHPRIEDGQVQLYLIMLNKNLQELRKRRLVSERQKKAGHMNHA